MSLHRDKDKRSSADDLLSHLFLADSMPSEHPINELTVESCNGNDSRRRNEHLALLNFVERCCCHHREQITRINYCSQISLPSIKHSENSAIADIYYLDNLNIALVIDEACDKVIAPKYECRKCNDTNSEDMKRFMKVLTSYKDFVLKDLNENSNIRWMSGDEVPHFDDAHQRVNALKCLLNTTLQLDPLNDIEPRQDNTMMIPMPLAPLYDLTIIEKLSERFYIPMNIIKLCFRDFIMGLLEMEQQENKLSDRIFKVDIQRDEQGKSGHIPLDSGNGIFFDENGVQIEKCVLEKSDSSHSDLNVQEDDFSVATTNAGVCAVSGDFYEDDFEN